MLGSKEDVRAQLSLFDQGICSLKLLETDCRRSSSSISGREQEQKMMASVKLHLNHDSGESMKTNNG